MTHPPSPYQQAIFDAVANTTDSLVIEAVAGSGKTTTIVEACNLIPRFNSVLFLAFNKNIATELQTRLPAHVQAKTYHSHAFNALSRALPHRPRVDGNKCKWLLKDMVPESDFYLYMPFVLKLVSYAKNCGVGALVDDHVDAYRAIVDHHGIWMDDDADEDYGISLAQQVLEASNEDLARVDFDDMLYLALLRKVHFDKFQYIFSDESQDTNAVQRVLLSRMLAPKPNGRLIAVGDSRQAIYGFRGSDSNAMDEIAKHFDCVKLPLSVCYRCDQAPVKEAQKYVEHILPRDNAPEGKVEWLTEYTPDTFKRTDAILCRNVSPLVSFAFALIRRNVGCRVLGRDIGAGLTTLVTKMNTQDVEQLADKLERYREREEAKATRRGNMAAAEAVNDKVACLNLFIENLVEGGTVGDILLKIDSLFSDNGEGTLTLATVHKSKGLEWDRVFILDRHRMPSKYAKQPWQIHQETNLIYVAVTRAKHELYYIKSDSWKMPKREEVKPTREELLDTI